MHTPIHIPYFNGFKYTHPHRSAKTSEAGHRNIKVFPGQADSVFKQVRLGQLSDRASKKKNKKKITAMSTVRLLENKPDAAWLKWSVGQSYLTVFLTGRVNDVGFDGLLLLPNNSLCLFSERFAVQPWTAATPQRLCEINPNWYISQSPSFFSILKRFLDYNNNFQLFL